MKRGYLTAVLMVCASLAVLPACEMESEQEGVGEIEGALGVTFEVGPGKPYADLQSVASRVTAGDTVRVYWRSTPYPGGVLLTVNGTAANRIKIVGVRGTDGSRPVISGGTNTIELQGDYTTIEGVTFTGGSARCVFHHAHAIVLSDVRVTDCPQHGILGADTDSGSLTVQYSEITRSGSGTQKHPIYMATDEVAYPGSVFRLEHTWIHDNNGGNAVKSRAERNEIYYNWLEGAYYRELELIAPEYTSASLKREDGDIVGNVFVKKSASAAVRIGGDGLGIPSSSARYRFAWNTFIQTASSPLAVQGFDRVESVEFHNNVFFRADGGAVRVLSQADLIWSSGAARISGSRNWIASGSSDVPSQLTNTLTGTNPGLISVSGWDLRPASGSALLDASTVPTTSPSGYAFPSPLATPVKHAVRGVVAPGAAPARPLVGALDVGALEAGAGSTPPPPPPATTCVTALPAGPVAVNTPMTSRTGTFTIEADVTPTGASPAAAFALSRGAQTWWTSFAAIVMFKEGVIQVRNGSSYFYSTTPYTSGATYHLRLVVNVAAHTYAVYVRPAGGSEITLGTSFAFRSEQSTLTSLDSWAAFAPETGSIKVCSVTTTP